MGGHGHSGNRSRASRKLRARQPSSSISSDPNPKPNPNPNSDSANPNDAMLLHESECGYCTEDQLEDLLLKNLDFAYHEALARLGALGYAPDVAMHAVLCVGHCCGPSDVISNIVANAVDYLNNPTGDGDGDGSGSASSVGGAGAGFSDLRRLEEYSLAGMVCMVQQSRRGISRGDAMWCLLMGELHVPRACQIHLPPPNCCSPDLPSPSSCCSSLPPGNNRCCPGDAADVALTAGKCCSGMTAGGCDVAVMGGGCCSGMAAGGMRFRPFARMGRGGGGQGSEDFIDELLKELEELQLEEKSTEPDAHAERIYDLIRQAREMEGQVKERKEWAQQKALQAARKLSHDTMELRNLRMEREKRERMKKAPVVPDESTTKRLQQMEEALKKASLQVDRANGEVQRLESENAEIRAEMEAAKLSADESIRARQEAAKREKKVRKKSQSRDRQKQQLQDEINEAKQQQIDVRSEIDRTERSTKQAEVLLREETKAKEEALTQLDDLHKLTDGAKSNAQRRLDALRQKTNLDAQRCKDDILRLQEDLSRLQIPNTTTNNNNNNIGNNNIINNNKATNNGVVRRVEAKDRKGQVAISRKWQCVVCVKDEVSVLLLPCAHQVLCVGCSESHVSMGKGRCPCCNSKIEDRIRVFGVTV